VGIGKRQKARGNRCYPEKIVGWVEALRNPTNPPFGWVVPPAHLAVNVPQPNLHISRFLALTEPYWGWGDLNV